MTARTRGARRDQDTAAKLVGTIGVPGAAADPDQLLDAVDRLRCVPHLPGDRDVFSATQRTGTAR